MKKYTDWYEWEIEIDKNKYKIKGTIDRIEQEIIYLFEKHWKSVPEDIKEDIEKEKNWFK